jgi:hypothetical protein
MKQAATTPRKPRIISPSLASVPIRNLPAAAAVTNRASLFATENSAAISGVSRCEPFATTRPISRKRVSDQANFV